MRRKLSIDANKQTTSSFLSSQHVPGQPHLLGKCVEVDQHFSKGDRYFLNITPCGACTWGLDHFRPAQQTPHSRATLTLGLEKLS